jgi:large subunit ribosomal protein L30
MKGTMAESTGKTINIKWVRSGIGFTRHQKKMVRSLGLLRLNHVVARPDTPQIRGLVESIPHLAEIVAPPEKPAWMMVPEYTIIPPTAEELAAAREAKKQAKVAKPAAEVAGAEKAGVTQDEPEEAAAEPAAKAKKAAKASAGKSKAAKSGAGKKPKKAEKDSKSAKKTRK